MNRHLLLFGLAVALNADAWDGTGHMLVAQIARDRMSSQAVARVDALAAQLEKNGVPYNGVSIACWPDDIKDKASKSPFQGQFRTWHYIDIGCLPSDPDVLGGRPVLNGATGEVITALNHCVELIRNKTTDSLVPKEEVALALLIHFVGDIHQPLHCATRVDSANPEGDRGGNLVSLMVPGKNGKLKKTNLHSFWDGGIGTFPPARPNFAPPPLSKIPAAAAKAMAGNPATAPGVKQNDPFNFSAWADESSKLADDVAYKGMKNGTKPSATYKTKALKVANQRVAWGGYRLAALLNAIWP